MSEEDLGRAVYEAIRENLRSLRETGRTTPPDFWEGIKDRVSQECPVEFERAKEVVTEWNRGEFDQNQFDQYLDTLRDDYEHKIESGKIREIDRG